ncbi:AAA family ATPase [Leptospira santarosai]|uniref:AAA family ATPase n=1 Tax=Leptospira santarosai TaxID=28183 RepID=UPI0002BF2E66|nr:AAA family ATPase [Leptospira santarosai]EMP03962.1 CobQ/CobB/MinD/ParA nucleotide binding domain protein [Leptospira santarosai str. HAI1380]
MIHKKSIPRKIQKLAYQEADSKCAICSESDIATLEIHHIASRRMGGGHDLENLLLLCSNCHSKATYNQIPKETIYQAKIKSLYRLNQISNPSNLMNSTTCVVVTIEKGGIGRSTLSILLSLEAAKSGRKVLLIDATYLGCTSKSVLENFEEYEISKDNIHMKYDENISINAFVKNTKHDNMDVLPLGVYARRFLIQLFAKKMQLIERLRKITLNYDLVILDIDSVSSEAKSLALILSNFALIPVEPNRWATDSLMRTFRILKKVNEEKELLIETNQFSKIQIAGILLNKFKIFNKKERLCAIDLQGQFPDLLMKNYLSEDPRFPKFSEDFSFLPEDKSIMTFQIKQMYKELMNNIKYAKKNNIIEQTLSSD